MTTVLVFPSSNEPGLEVAQALLKSNKLKVLGGSSYDPTYDPSRVLLDGHLHCPPLEAPHFRERFGNLLVEHGIDLVFPTVDAVVAELSTWRDRPAIFVTSNPASTDLFLSKRKTYERLSGVVPVPRVHVEDPPSYPAFAKPDSGSGSRGSFVVGSDEELRVARSAGLLVHEFLPGEEFTVDCVNDLRSTMLYAHPRARGRIGRGMSLGTAHVANEELRDNVEGIVREVPIEGPWFAQFKVAGDGTPTLLEVNLRVAGSMTLTRLSGVNIPLLSTFMFLGHAVEVPAAMDGVVLNRFLRNVGDVGDFDWLVWDLDDTIVRKDGKADPDVIARLYDFDNQGKHQLLLTKREDAVSLLQELRVPELFVEVRISYDKVDELGRVLSDHRVDPRRCIMVNDSYSERLALERRHPGLRVVMPDSLDVLGRERLS